MLKKQIRYSMVVCMMLLGAYRLAIASDEKVTIVTENFPPFNYQKDSEVQGIATQIVRKLFEEAKVPYQLSLLPWKRAYRMALNEPNTFIYTMARTESREDKFRWLAKISNRKIHLFRLKERQDLAKMSFEDAKSSAKIACISGDASTETLKRMGFPPENLNLFRDSTISNFTMRNVMKSWSDFFPMNPFELRHRVRHGEIDDIFTDQFVIYDADGYYLAANIRTDHDLRKALRETYAQLLQKGYIEKVIGDYLKGN